MNVITVSVQLYFLIYLYSVSHKVDALVFLLIAYSSTHYIETLHK